MNKRYCIINTENRAAVDKLKEYGYECIATQKSCNVSKPISLHADVLYLKTGDKEIYVSDCQKHNIGFLIGLGYRVSEINLAPGYKTESKLNMIVTEGTVVCNPYTCIEYNSFGNKKEIITVKQGYTRCSTIVLSDNNFITEDEGIYKNLTASDKNCLLIEKGYVFLEGYDYGFIGGASVFLERENTLLFFGDITLHKDYKKINDFCNKSKIKIDYIVSAKLQDIGGAILIN